MCLDQKSGKILNMLKTIELKLKHWSQAVKQRLYRLEKGTAPLKKSGNQGAEFLWSLWELIIHELLNPIVKVNFYKVLSLCKNGLLLLALLEVLYTHDQSIYLIWYCIALEYEETIVTDSRTLKMDGLKTFSQNWLSSPGTEKLKCLA